MAELEELNQKVDRIVEEVHIVRAGLYGNKSLPGMEGDIPEIKTHLVKLNGRVDKIKDNTDINTAAIQMLNERWKWLRVIVAVALGAVITTIGWLANYYL